jgi:transcriptional regulator with XRE-family HTH domain
LGEGKIEEEAKRKLEQWLFGAKLKKMRKTSSLTLEEVAAKINVSSAFLSLVENGRSGIGISKLEALLKVYNANLNTLYGDLPENDVVLPLEKTTKLNYEQEGVSGYMLTKKAQEKHVYAIYLRFEPGACLGPVSHKGEEICFILKGSFVFEIKDKGSRKIKTYTANKWDTITYRGDAAHTVRNISRGVSELHSIIYNVTS